MKYTFDKKIAENLRRTINSNNYFVMKHFADYTQLNQKEKKNLWSKICSCMDWIDVSLSGLQSKPNFSRKHHNKGALEFAHFILTVDILTEAINNIWNTFSLADEIKSSPLKKDSSVFEGDIFGKKVSDEVYFKHIRAFFGMHAVNGNEISLEVDGEYIRARFFSSWSTSLDGENFSISLYSNNREIERRYGGQLKITVEKILQYAHTRYMSLIELTSLLENFYIITKKYTIENNQISLSNNLSTLEKIKALRTFSKETIYLKDYYSQHIDWYIKMLQIDLEKFEQKDKSRISNYLKELELKVIPAYQCSLNTMDDTPSKDIELILPDFLFQSDYMYEYSKILNFCEYEIGDLDDISYESAKLAKGFSLSILIEDEELPQYCLNLTKEELYLLIQARAFEMNRKYFN